MTLNVGKRILVFLHWILSLLICLALVLHHVASGMMNGLHAALERALGPTGLLVTGILLLVVYALLAALVAGMLFRRRRRSERGYITVNASDTGRVRIAVSAIEQMVRQSVRAIEGIDEMKIDIDSQDDAIVIGVNAVILSGSHVPTLTTNMQRSIRQFVEVNCGVSVQSVSVSINSVAAPAETTRRRRLGRVKPDALKSPFGQAIRRKDADSAPDGGSDVPESPDLTADDGESRRSGPVQYGPAPEEEEPTADQEEPTEVYDFDRPYESEFAKDLAALRAREAAAGLEAGAADQTAQSDEEP